MYDPDSCDHEVHMYDAFIHDACFYDACIHDVMHVSMILDLDTCRYDAYIYPDTRDYDAHCTYMYDAFIHDP